MIISEYLWLALSMFMHGNQRTIYNNPNQNRPLITMSDMKSIYNASQSDSEFIRFDLVSHHDNVSMFSNNVSDIVTWILQSQSLKKMTYYSWVEEKDMKTFHHQDSASQLPCSFVYFFVHIRHFYHFSTVLDVLWIELWHYRHQCFSTMGFSVNSFSMKLVLPGQGAIYLIIKIKIDQKWLWLNYQPS